MNDAQILLFLITSILLIITPGQDFMLVMTRSISMGRKAGLATISGVSSSLVIHSFLVAFGLGALLQRSETLFTTMKIIGALYLLYLGIKTFMARPVSLDIKESNQIAVRRLFLEGLISNLCNPKVIIFYIAFLPQFIAADNPHTTETLLILGMVFAVITFVLIGAIGLLAGSLSGWLRKNQFVQSMLNKISGTILIGFAIHLFVSEKPA